MKAIVILGAGFEEGVCPSLRGFVAASSLRFWLGLPLLLMLAAALLPGPWAWSLDHLAYLPGPRWLALLWPLVALATLWSPLAGRVGAPEDVAEVIVFLASEQAHWLTGQLLYVGGGYRMHQ